MKDLQQAIGQYVMYYRVLIKNNIRRDLYLAVPERTFESVFTIDLGRLFLKDTFIRLMVFDDEKEMITKWIPD